MNVALTVIVPVYNVRDYLHECVDSILKQSFSDLELVLVDDGSTDGSETICDDYEQKDDRVRVVHQENRGQSSARNKGVKLAQGEWITFVDSDDVLPSDAIANMMAKRGEFIDVIIGRLEAFGESKGIFPLSQDDFSGIDTQGLSGIEAFALLVERIPTPLWAPGRNYIRRAFWHDISAGFPVGITNEDMYLLPRVQMKAREIALCNQVVYRYRYARPDSTMTIKSLSRELCFFKVVESFKEFFLQNPRYAVAREGMLRQIGKLQYSVICRLGVYNAEEQKQILKAALPHADLMRDCIYAKKWRLFFSLFGNRITYKLMAYRHKGK